MIKSTQFVIFHRIFIIWYYAFHRLAASSGTNFWELQHKYLYIATGEEKRGGLGRGCGRGERGAV
jgi:hypothetical protein